MHVCALKHRSSSDTVLGSPHINSNGIFYDFSTDASKAYQNNQVNIGSGVYAIYSGDVDQDNSVDLSDLTDVESNSQLTSYGYFSCDLTGDNKCESTDYSLVENNYNGGVMVKKP